MNQLEYFCSIPYYNINYNLIKFYDLTMFNTGDTFSTSDMQLS